jgi:DtxR family transcriptional regulator, Mn-dependent transcriptional regulator
VEPVPAPYLLECVEAIYRLGRERASVALAQLGKRLRLGRAATMERILALQAQGLVRAHDAERITLTPEAERVALGLVRKHRLLERFLVDTLRLPWDQVHEEARRLTPVLSDVIADGLAKLLGDPATCPHGNPIPSAALVLPEEHGTPLHRLRPGQGGIIVRIEREEAELLKYLASLGLLPQTKLEVEEVAPFGGPILVRVGDSRYALGRNVASRIFVREL